ncbi:MAG TPA: OmpA family protein [Taishania sp.]|nr:OmpA family protein [Taishania sp.]
MKLIQTILLFCCLHVSFGQSHLKPIDFNKLRLQFDDASAELRPEYIPLLYRLADTLKKSPNLHLTIRGHVCCVNKNALAVQRAKSVEKYLLQFGVKKEQMTVVGMRNSMPIANPEKTREDQLTNMRVDFILR